MVVLCFVLVLLSWLLFLCVVWIDKLGANLADGWFVCLSRSSLILIGSAMFGAIFNLVTRVGLPLFLKN